MTQPPVGPQQPYQQGPQPGLPPTASNATRSGPLDVRFTRSLSLSLVSVWWILALIVFGLAGIIGMISGFIALANGDNTFLSLLIVIGSVGGAIVGIVLTRLFLESVAVLFRIADNTAAMARQRV